MVARSALIFTNIVTDKVHKIFMPGRLAPFAYLNIDMGLALLALSLLKIKRTFT